MAGNGSFDEGIDHLIREVGYGRIVAGCLVDQPYAQDQHETPYEHERGQRGYLRDPLMEDANALVQIVASRVITETGSDLHDAMVDVADIMVMFVAKNAPMDTGRLSTSGSPWVTSDGVEVYRRPPISPRDASELPGKRKKKGSS